MTGRSAEDLQRVDGRVVRGHGVASGVRADPAKFPGGTIRMQLEPFQRLGLDLAGYHPGTINVSIHPRQFRAVHARRILRAVRWHPTEPAEDFSFFDVALIHDGQPHDGLVYYPHLETKPAHFQSPDVLELLMPFIAGIGYDEEVELLIPKAQIEIR